MRGIKQQTIFEGDEDNERFLETIIRRIAGSEATYIGITSNTVESGICPRQV